MAYNSYNMLQLIFLKQDNTTSFPATSSNCTHAVGTGAGAEAPKTQHNSRQLLYVTLSLVLASADTQLQACTVQTALFGSRCNKED